MSEHPAGWYPDPRGRHEYRYWDGSAWSDHVADAGVAATDSVDVVGPKASDAAARSAEPARPEPARSEDPAAESTRPAEPAAEQTSSLWTAGAAGDAPTAAAEPGDGVAGRPAAAPPGDDGTVAGEAAAGAPADEPRAAADEPGAPADEPHPAADEPRPGGDEPTAADQARDALKSATATKSPALAGLLTIAFPGSGHLYLGAGDKAAVAGGLLAATVAAYVLAWFSFATFVVGFVVWAAAAVFGLMDLQAVLKPIREAGAAAASISPQQVGLVLLGGGVLLIIGLSLPWYHLSEITVRTGSTPPLTYGPSVDPGVPSSGTGFQALGFVDIVLLAIAVASIVLGVTAMGLGPLKGQKLPTWLPTAVALVGLVGLVLVAFRLIFAVPSFFTPALLDLEVIDSSLGRGPGILLSGAATLAIAAAGVATLIQAPRANSASRDEPATAA